MADSGARETAENGFIREPESGEKHDWTWIFETRGLELVPPELIQRIAEHFYQGGLKYEPDNWKRGTDPAALGRYRRSAARHFAAWMRHEDDEDHAAACAWNLFVFEINRAMANQLWLEHGPDPSAAAYLDATDPPRPWLGPDDDAPMQPPRADDDDPAVPPLKLGPSEDLVRLAREAAAEAAPVMPCGHTAGNHPMYCERG